MHFEAYLQSVKSCKWWLTTNEAGIAANLQHKIGTVLEMSEGQTMQW